MANPAAPSKAGAFDLSEWGASPNSVASHKGLVVAAVQADPKTDPGKAVFFLATGTSADDGFVAAVTVGALPDMVTFTPDGKRVLVANEAEPDFYGEGNSDSEGSVSIIDVSKGSGSIAQTDVTTATFTAFNGLELDESIRIYGPGATVAMDLDVLDLGAETLSVVPESDSPTGKPVLVICNEVSGTTTLFEITPAK